MLENYDLKCQIAQTDHTQVWLCEHKLLKQERIIKIVNKSKDGARILQEAHWMKQFRHEAIPRIYDVIEDDSSICIIEEYIAGKSLSEYLRIKRCLSEQEIIGYGIQLCEVLEYLHHFKENGVLHLDLKPENIFINEEGKLKLLDFDHAIAMNQAVSEGYGSIGYAAPEQYFAGKVNASADIYAVGMLLLYMTQSGCIQSYADGTMDISHLQSKPIYTIIKKCIHHHSFQRYASITTVKRELKCLSDRVEYKNNKKPLSNQNTYHIYVHGSRRGVGTTHVSLCLASYIAGRQDRIAYVGHSKAGDLLGTVMQKGVLQENGAYHLHNIDILPNYQDRIACDCEKYQFQIHDCGTQSVSEIRKKPYYQEGSIHIYVTDLGYRRQEDESIRMQLPESVKIVINHIDGMRFYQELKNKQEESIWVRMPWIYDWKKCDKIFEQTAKELLGDLYVSYFMKNSCNKYRYNIKSIWKAVCGQIWHRKENAHTTFIT